MKMHSDEHKKATQSQVEAYYLKIIQFDLNVEF